MITQQEFELADYNFTAQHFIHNIKVTTSFCFKMNHCQVSRLIHLSGWSCQILVPIWLSWSYSLNSSCGNHQTFFFILKVLEGGDWGSILLRETWLWPLFNLKALAFGYWKVDISRGSKSPSYTGQCNHNQSEWIFPLVNSQLKLDSMMAGEILTQKKKLENI